MHCKEISKKEKVFYKDCYMLEVPQRKTPVNRDISGPRNIFFSFSYMKTGRWGQQRIVSNCRHTIHMTNDRPVYN